MDHIRDPRELVRVGYDLASHAYRGDTFELERLGLRATGSAGSRRCSRTARACSTWAAAAACRSRASWRSAAP